MGSNWKGELLICYLNLIQKHVKTDSILQNSGPVPVKQLAELQLSPKLPSQNFHRSFHPTLRHLQLSLLPV